MLALLPLPQLLLLARDTSSSTLCWFLDLLATVEFDPLMKLQPAGQSLLTIPTKRVRYANSSGKGTQ